MNKLISFSFLFIIILGIIISCFSTSFDYSSYNIDENSIYTSVSGYTWPIPNFYRISSYFGYRSSPTASASSYHKGIDIPAVENTYFLASISGNIVYTGFMGSARLYYYIGKRR